MAIKNKSIFYKFMDFIYYIFGYNNIKREEAINKYYEDVDNYYDDERVMWHDGH